MPAGTKDAAKLREMMQNAGAVLVVDDAQRAREALCDLLRRHGYDAVSADSGRRAIHSIQSRSFDVVLLDIMMPDMTGYEVLEMIRQSHSSAELPIVVTSALDRKEDLIRALGLGANDYVSKPLDLPVLLARLRTQVELRAAVQQILVLEDKLKARNEQLENANQRMRDDLSVAAELQSALLPSTPPDVPGFAFHWLFKPAAELAGDMLNVFQLDGEHVGLYVLAVKGNDLRAALLSVAVTRYLTPGLGPGSVLWEWQQEATGGRYVLSSPANVADRLNRRFGFNLKTRQSFSFVYAVLHLPTRRVQYATAGHPGPIFVPHVEPARRLDGDGKPIGLADQRFQTHELVLGPLDRLYFYSNGLVAAKRQDGEPFGLPRLNDALEARRDLSLEESLAGLWEDLGLWCQPRRPQDDVSVLAVKCPSAV